MTYKEAFKKVKGYLYDVLDGDEAYEIIKALEEQTRWIPVSEKLPEERNHYLITIEIDGMNGCKPYYEIQTSWYSGKEFVVEYKDDGLVAKKSVIAWMPLESYNAESEEEDEECYDKRRN